MLASLLNMIEVTRLNGKGFMLNALHIEQIEVFQTRPLLWPMERNSL